jgi:predicted dehydrogenase
MSAAGKNTPGYDDFILFKTNLEESGVKFFATVKEVPPPADDKTTKRLAIISARTADNPKLFAECLDIGCHSIFLEKPGAPSLAELEKMMNDAQNAGVNVFMGFNKNVSKYVAKTREYEAQHPGVKVTYVHNNNYEDSEASLGECFERNAEGMLKNMAIHELALVVTYYGVTVDSVASVEADKEFSACKSLKGPSGGVFTDFDKLKFTITTKAGKVISILADRCGGDDSVGIGTDADGKELVRFTMPDGEDAIQIESAEKRVPGAMPYFYMQDPDYSTLKQRVAKAMLDGSKPEGVATIEVAVDSLKLAEYLTPILQKQLL